MLPCLPFLSKECYGASAGTGAGLGAHLLWGFAVLFWPLLTGMDPVSIMSHRMIWTVAFLGGVLAATGHLDAVRDAFKSVQRIDLQMVRNYWILCNLIYKIISKLKK